MWGARLLPFSELLSRTRNGAEIKDVVLSLISELPSSKFVADLLALHFPGSGSGDSRYLDAKLKRLLSRLRSTCDDTPLQLAVDGNGATQPEPLSVRYQTISQMLVEAHKSLSISVGKFQTIVPATTDCCVIWEALPLHETALEVGSFLFEHDTAYLSFLDTLFSVVIGQSEESSKIQMQHISSSRMHEGLYHGKAAPPAHLPYLGSYLSKMAATPDSGVGCWEYVLPLLTALSSWSQTSTSATTLSQQKSKTLAVSTKTSAPRKSSRMKYLRSNSRELQSHALRVNISVLFILNCLKNNEDKVMEFMVRTGEHRSGDLEAVQAPPSEMPPETRKCSVVTPGIQDGDTSRSLCLADLDTSLHAPSFMEQHAPENFPLKQSTLETTGGRTNRGLAGLALLQVPQGVLQVRVGLGSTKPVQP